MKFEEYALYDAIGLKLLLEAGEISADELHDIVIKAIETLNPKLNFLISFSPEETERALTHLDPQAMFAGIPFLMKEGVGMTGQPAYMGCSFAKGVNLGVAY